ncbi:phenylalanine ammonia-lyase [Penicillium macrosclerotiorum]|uniref:phenylalanine ammonia-lyase n=1 Tax=Penicillium macrosclerotiorum TaxID=303699 RepID=UPI0025465A78|nr:phenylalanine ammonia-lyase [Penicillium macrosclerotiorum]KAJ5692445.1 phenylalanine ammonia-lyase [Penicillium macrosclerotiorum]
MGTAKHSPHTSATLQLWRRLRDLRDKKQSIVLDGNNLDIASIVAVARHEVTPTISMDEQLSKQLDLSVQTLIDHLSRGHVIYGVNTGFGGSADTRTNDHIDLQTHLLQFIQSGIITAADKDPAANWERKPSHVMPPAWVRGTIVARANQNLRGHSAIRKSVLKSLVDLLNHDLVPLIPLRGTISASGDLMPMSYIAGAITGNPDVFVQVGKGPKTRVMPSSEALKISGLSPSGLGPKEALGLINGTAPSVAVASLVLYDTQQLALLSQMLTAFAAEALGGNVEWALPFIHATRPHPGQIEVASNIRGFLKGSKLVVGLDSRKKNGDGLWQDRYSTRTAPQWVGPYLEDLLLAQRQLEVELNSTSDNPLVDTGDGDGASSGGVYSGGNFQAAVVTSAMDKARLAIQMIGRMLWSQVTEIINPATNNGLEANLNASAHENYTMKGIDINMSAYMSELAALAHPVSAHVMSAEMHNQGINSLALISARRTMEAVDILAHMSACHLYVSCQAVDLRAAHVRFLSTLHNKMKDNSPSGALHGLGLTASQIDKLVLSLFPVVEATWYQSNSNTWKDRVSAVVEAIVSPVTNFIVKIQHDCSVAKIVAFKDSFADIVSKTAESMFYPSATISPTEVSLQLGEGTALLYTWLRSKLNIPLHCGIEDDPLYNAQKGLSTEGKKSIGSWVSIVYESLLEGGMMDMVLDNLDATPNLEAAGYLGLKVSNGLNGVKAVGRNHQLTRAKIGQVS